jgi:sulfite reductase subunit B
MVQSYSPEPAGEHYLPEPAQVVHVDRRTSDALLELRMAASNVFRYQPGQFVQVSVFGYGEVPISICSSPNRDGTFQLCVRPVGNVTSALHAMSVGDWLGIRGPYGRSFRLNPWINRDLLIVAGGIGLAPLRSLINFVRDNRANYGRLIVAYGARKPSLILFAEELEAWEQDPGVEVYITVDEADETWHRRTGVVTEPLRDIDIQAHRTRAVVVGPPVMYRFVAAELLDKEMSEDHIYFSLERHFKCGVGKCGHCQLNELYVCQDGPVFRYSRLLGHTEAVEVWAPEKDED